MRNTGDAPIYYCGPEATPSLQSTLDNGLNPSTITSANIPFSSVMGPNSGSETCGPGIGAGVLTPNNSTEV